MQSTFRDRDREFINRIIIVSLVLAMHLCSHQVRCQSSRHTQYQDPQLFSIALISLSLSPLIPIDRT